MLNQIIEPQFAPSENAPIAKLSKKERRKAKKLAKRSLKAERKDAKRRLQMRLSVPGGIGVTFQRA